MTTQQFNFAQNFKASVEISDLEKLGWNIDAANSENYHVDIRVDEDGKTLWCLTNTEKANNGIWEGSDSEATGDDEQTIKDLEQLYTEGKLWNCENYL